MRNIKITFLLICLGYANAPVGNDLGLGNRLGGSNPLANSRPDQLYYIPRNVREDCDTWSEPGSNTSKDEEFAMHLHMQDNPQWPEYSKETHTKLGSADSRMRTNELGNRMSAVIKRAGLVLPQTVKSGLMNEFFAFVYTNLASVKLNFFHEKNGFTTKFFEHVCGQFGSEEWGVAMQGHLAFTRLLQKLIDQRSSSASVTSNDSRMHESQRSQLTVSTQPAHLSTEESDFVEDLIGQVERLIKRDGIRLCTALANADENILKSSNYDHVYAYAVSSTLACIKAFISGIHDLIKQRQNIRLPENVSAELFHVDMILFEACQSLNSDFINLETVFRITEQITNCIMVAYNQHYQSLKDILPSNHQIADRIYSLIDDFMDQIISINEYSRKLKQCIQQLSVSEQSTPADVYSNGGGGHTPANHGQTANHGRNDWLHVQDEFGMHPNPASTSSTANQGSRTTSVAPSLAAGISDLNEVQIQSVVRSINSNTNAWVYYLKTLYDNVTYGLKYRSEASANKEMAINVFPLLKSSLDRYLINPLKTQGLKGIKFNGISYTFPNDISQQSFNELIPLFKVLHAVIMTHAPEGYSEQSNTELRDQWNAHTDGINDMVRFLETDLDYLINPTK